MDVAELPALVAELDRTHRARGGLFVVMTVWPSQFCIELFNPGANSDQKFSAATAAEAIAATSAELARDLVAEQLAAIGCNPDGRIMAEYRRAA
jgi:hypothetical protein